MANDTEAEIAHLDMRELGELKLTNKRLYGRVRLIPTPNEVKNGGAGIIRTTKGVFRERDFDAPVSTIENIPGNCPMIRRATGWIGTVIQTVIATVILTFSFGSFISAVMGFLTFIVVGGIGGYMSYRRYKADQKIFIFQFVGNGEVMRFILPIERKGEIEDFVNKMMEAKQKALA